MLLFNVLAVIYFLLGFYICGQAGNRTREAEALNASLLEELKSARQELTKATKALDGIKS